MCLYPYQQRLFPYFCNANGGFDALPNKKKDQERMACIACCIVDLQALGNTFDTKYQSLAGLSVQLAFFPPALSLGFVWSLF